jgi:hypothetical protein
MSGNISEEKQRVLDALRERRYQLFYAREKLLDEEASPDGQTVRELLEELERLGSERRTNPEGWSPEQEERYQHLHQNPRYLNEFVPLTRQWHRAERKYRDMLLDLERSGQAARSEAAPPSKKVPEVESAGPSTPDFSANKSFFDFNKVTQWWRDARIYHRLFRDLERTGQGTCSEVTPYPPKKDDVTVLEDKKGGLNTADFIENKPLLTQDAYSNDFNSNVPGNLVRQRAISHPVGC